MSTTFFFTLLIHIVYYIKYKEIGGVKGDKFFFLVAIYPHYVIDILAGVFASILIEKKKAQPAQPASSNEAA